MGKLEPLITGRVVAFDTAPLIYFIEENQSYLPLVEDLFESIGSGAAQGVTSVLTLLEVLVKPMRDGASEIADKYREILTNSTGISLYPVGVAVVEGAADLLLNTLGYVPPTPSNSPPPLYTVRTPSSPMTTAGGE